MEGQPHLALKGEKAVADNLDEAAAAASEFVFVKGNNSITSGEGRDCCDLVWGMNLLH